MAWVLVLLVVNALVSALCKMMFLGPRRRPIMFPRSFDGLRRIVCALRLFRHFGLMSFSFSARSCHGFFHMAFRLLWQWTHSAAGQEPDTRIFTGTVEDDCPFLRHCTIKACFWMRLHHADEILLPWIAFKVREHFNNVAQFSDAHALQRFLDGSPPLFTQSFHIYKFIEWHRWLLPLITFEVDTSRNRCLKRRGILSWFCVVP